MNRLTFASPFMNCGSSSLSSLCYAAVRFVSNSCPISDSQSTAVRHRKRLGSARTKGSRKRKDGSKPRWRYTEANVSRGFINRSSYRIQSTLSRSRCRSQVRKLPAKWFTRRLFADWINDAARFSRSKANRTHRPGHELLPAGFPVAVAFRAVSWSVKQACRLS